jgi:hypothetical protein
VDQTTKEAAPPPTDEELLPAPLLIRAAGSVTLQDWDTDAYILKDQIVDLFKKISNRRRENGAPSNDYLILECQRLPSNNSKAATAYGRRYGAERCTLDEAYDAIRTNQGTTVRELTLKLFANAAAPPALEPRVRSMLHRLKSKGWAAPRYDDRGVQRWYAIDIITPPDDWDARSRAISYTLVDLWGGNPRDYVRQVEALCALMDAQGERALDPKAWIVERESPF